MNNNKNILSLHKYFLTSNFLYYDFHNYIKNNKNSKYFSIESLYKMGLWYSTLYVVIEGWEQNKLIDSKINNLLNNKENINKLRLYRNGTFHFQKKYWNTKINSILGDNDFILWIEKLHKEFNFWFLTYFK